jgi:uncharacterized membrane protein (DUF106 family)
MEHIICSYVYVCLIFVGMQHGYAHLISLDLIMLIFLEEYKLCSFALSNFLKSSFNSS